MYRGKSVVGRCSLDVLKNLFDIVGQVIELGGPRKKGRFREPMFNKCRSLQRDRTHEPRKGHEIKL